MFFPSNDGSRTGCCFFASEETDKILFFLPRGVSASFHIHLYIHIYIYIHLYFISIKSCRILFFMHTAVQNAPLGPLS